MSALSKPAEQALYSIRSCAEDDGGDRERLLNACAATLERELTQDVSAPHGYRLQPLAEFDAMCAHLYYEAYHAGHHDTVGGQYIDVLPVDADTYWAGQVTEYTHPIAPADHTAAEVPDEANRVTKLEERLAAERDIGDRMWDARGSSTIEAHEMISAQYVDGLELRIKELEDWIEHARGEAETRIQLRMRLQDDRIKELEEQLADAKANATRQSEIADKYETRYFAEHETVLRQAARIAELTVKYEARLHKSKERDAERDAFERWYDSPMPPERNTAGEYKNINALVYWNAWRSAAAHERGACAKVCDEMAAILTTLVRTIDVGVPLALRLANLSAMPPQHVLFLERIDGVLAKYKEMK